MLRPLPALIAACLLPLLAGGCGSTQKPPPVTIPPRTTAEAIPSPLPLAEALRIALANDPSSRALAHRVSGAHWEHVQALRFANPSLTVSLDPSEWVAGLLWRFDELLRRPKQGAVAQSLEEQATLELMKRRIDLARDVRLAYAEIAHAEALRGLLDRRRQLTRSAAETTRRRQEIGDASSLERIRAENADISARGDLEGIAPKRQQGVARLNRLLGLDPSTPRQIAFRPEEDLTVNHGLTDKAIFLGRRPEIALAAARIREQEARLSMVSASLTYVPQIEGGPYLKGTEGDRLGGATMRVTLPIFDTGDAARKSHGAALDALQEELVGAEAQVLLEFHLAALELDRAKSRLDSAQGVLENFRKASDTVRQSAEAGSVNRLAVADAELQQVDAEAALADVRHDLWVAAARFLAAAGDAGLEPEPGKETPPSR